MCATKIMDGVRERKRKKNGNHGCLTDVMIQHKENKCWISLFTYMGVLLYKACEYWPAWLLRTLLLHQFILQ